MCQECGNSTIVDFDKEIRQFKNRFDLLYFLTDTLLYITYNGWYYCYCRDTDKCLLCRISPIFNGFKKKNIKNAPRIILTFGQQEIISLFDSIF